MNDSWGQKWYVDAMIAWLDAQHNAQLAAKAEARRVRHRKAADIRRKRNRK